MKKTILTLIAIVFITMAYSQSSTKEKKEKSKKTIVKEEPEQTPIRKNAITIENPTPKSLKKNGNKK